MNEQGEGKVLLIEHTGSDLCSMVGDQIAKKAYENMDDYIWGAPHMMAPFIQLAPQPGDYKSAVINSTQFRSKKEVSVPKPSKTYRIFLTGGSTAFGSRVAR